jgi:DHA3 family macrolide efflux protein-like MFS transporter
MENPTTSTAIPESWATKFFTIWGGQAFSLISAGAAAMMPLSLLIAGPVSDWLGVRVWYVFGGAVCILTAVAVLFIPAIEKIEQNRLPTSEKVNARPLVVSASVGS